MLEVRKLRKHFGGVTAIDDASLDVGPGQIVALIGPNGAGKTTLFAAISGFIKPDAGSVRLLGEDISNLAPHVICARGMVRTFQITQPFGRLSVVQNIMVATYNHAESKAEAFDRAREIAQSVGMGSMLDTESNNLTVAGRKRLELARALGTRPRILLLDEVMAGLNPTEIAEIIEVIEKIRAQGVSVLLIEHVMKAVMSLADKVYVLNDGHMIAQGTPREITANPQVIEAYLGKSAPGIHEGKSPC